MSFGRTRFGCPPSGGFVLAYNLANFFRCLALPRGIRPWTLTTLQEKVVKIRAKVVRHARYVVFQTCLSGGRRQVAEVAVSVASLGASLKDVRGDAEADSLFGVWAWIAQGARERGSCQGAGGKSAPTGPVGHFPGVAGPCKDGREHPASSNRPEFEKKLTIPRSIITLLPAELVKRPVNLASSGKSGFTPSRCMGFRRMAQAWLILATVIISVIGLGMDGVRCWFESSSGLSV